MLCDYLASRAKTGFPINEGFALRGQQRMVVTKRSRTSVRRRDITRQRREGPPINPGGNGNSRRQAPVSVGLTSPSWHARYAPNGGVYPANVRWASSAF
ncbi:hypothetical protein SAMD00023353_2301220 [Rosellinia necatrix]|uniref:Uncharacterized protein n=1 Tax=Rosellinia necatrix TaxID=77044 RepID=A0A1W2TGD6_ROSNE|nr:hypothetical protein SAMD00023353_2301220 [Rosellinia necatrix]